MISLPDGYDLAYDTPDTETFRRLRAAGDLADRTQEAATRGLAGTLIGVVIRHKGEIIGMGRVIGDGGCHYQIVDIVLMPDHRGLGLAKAIMAALMDRLNETAPKGAYVSLIADVPADKLYAQFGFKETAPRSIGMARFLD